MIEITENIAGKRFRDALGIQQGAVNPTAIARSLVAALYEMSGSDTASRTSDPAIRLIVHQLAYICNVSQIDSAADVYGKLIAACEEKDRVATVISPDL